MKMVGNVMHLKWNDPDDRRIGIESGAIWACPQKIQQLAVDDLFAGRAELNESVPPAIAKAVTEWRAKLVAHEGAPSVDPPAGGRLDRPDSAP